LKHTRKHKKRKGGSETRSTAHSFWRTVRPGSADRPRWAARTVRPATTDRPAYFADRPLNHTEPTGTHPSHGPSAGSTRTVRQAPADRPPSAADRPKLRPTENQNRNGSKRKAKKEHEEHGKNPSGADRPPGPRELSARCGQSRKCPTPKVNSPKSSSNFPNG
jgi:hypothetical protein